MLKFKVILQQSTSLSIQWALLLPGYSHGVACSLKTRVSYSLLRPLSIQVGDALRFSQLSTLDSSLFHFWCYPHLLQILLLPLPIVYVMSSLWMQGRGSIFGVYMDGTSDSESRFKQCGADRIGRHSPDPGQCWTSDLASNRITVHYHFHCQRI